MSVLLNVAVMMMIGFIIMTFIAVLVTLTLIWFWRK